MLFTIEEAAAFGQVVFADLVLAGDNAVAVGLAASGLSGRQQRQAILIGIVLALVLRIIFALVAIQLLNVPGLLLVGGLLLFWVAGRMYRDISGGGEGAHGGHAAAAANPGAEGAQTVSFTRALLSIVIADVSLSLDNVLVVAGVAREHPEIMAFGLILSVVLMGVAAEAIANVIQRYRWLAYAGIVVIVFAALRMVWEDGHNLLPTMVPAMPGWLGGGGHG